MCKSFNRQHASRNGRNIVSWKRPLEWVYINAYNFLLVDQSSSIFSVNMGGDVVDNAVFRFSLRRSVSEIFAIKVEIVRNRVEFFMFFCPPKFYWWNPSQKLYARYHGCLLAWHMARLREVNCTSPKVIGGIISQNLHVHPNKIFEGTLDHDCDVRQQALVNL